MMGNCDCGTKGVDLEYHRQFCLLMLNRGLTDKTTESEDRRLKIIQLQDERTELLVQVAELREAVEDLLSVCLPDPDSEESPLMTRAKALLARLTPSVTP